MTFDYQTLELLRQNHPAWRLLRSDHAPLIAELRRKSGLSQKELAKLLHTSQQQISRLESPRYEGHSLSMLRRVAHALHARVRVVFEPEEDVKGLRVAESGGGYKDK